MPRARRLVAQVERKLGRCPLCFRLSLVGAILGWVFLVLLGQLDPSRAVLATALLWPASFTMLWVAHVVVFGARTIRHANDHVLGTDPGQALTRRDTVRLFGAAIRYAVLISAAGVLTAASDCEPTPTTDDRRNPAPPPIQCPCRRPTNVYNSSFYLNGKAYPAGCYDKCYSTDCRTYNSC